MSRKFSFDELKWFSTQKEFFFYSYTYIHVFNIFLQIVYVDKIVIQEVEKLVYVDKNVYGNNIRWMLKIT